MKKLLLGPAIKALLPTLLGALGALFAMTYPQLHGPFCAGVMLGGA